MVLKLSGKCWAMFSVAAAFLIFCQNCDGVLDA
jgi:hypothetical protein